jgi:dTDP-4-amino-4,6-dideoxygalactose transaminase
MTIWRCDLVPQYRAHRTEIDAAIREVLESGRYVLAEQVAAFEREFSAYIGTAHGIGVNSGTDALILALLELGVRPGDEVLTTPFTAIPTYAAIHHVGAVPVFVDIEPDTFLMDLTRVEAALTSRTRGVVPVHLFGNAVDIEALRALVGPDRFILEDCAQAHGAEVRGRKVGSLGDAGAFSFYPTKNLGGYGDGGLVTTNDPDFAARLRRRRMYGMVSKDEFVSEGINTRLDELQSAILRVKLRHLDDANSRRRALAQAYAASLPAGHVVPQAVRDGVQSVVHVYAARVSGRRDALLQWLEARDIQANVYYPLPLYRQPGFQSTAGGRPHPALPVVEDVARRIIALPFYPELPEETLAAVADAVTRFFES